MKARCVFASIHVKVALAACCPWHLACLKHLFQVVLELHEVLCSLLVVTAAEAFHSFVLVYTSGYTLRGRHHLCVYSSQGNFVEIMEGFLRMLLVATLYEECNS